jgi:hypothetical protein
MKKRPRAIELVAAYLEIRARGRRPMLPEQWRAELQRAVPGLMISDVLSTASQLRAIAKCLDKVAPTMVADLELSASPALGAIEGPG